MTTKPAFIIDQQSLKLPVQDVSKTIIQVEALFKADETVDYLSPAERGYWKDLLQKLKALQD